MQFVGESGSEEAPPFDGWSSRSLAKNLPSIPYVQFEEPKPRGLDVSLMVPTTKKFREGEMQAWFKLVVFQVTPLDGLCTGGRGCLQPGSRSDTRFRPGDCPADLLRLRRPGCKQPRPPGACVNASFALQSVTPV